MPRDDSWNGTYDWDRKYDERTVKLLYGLSGNRCAHPDCNHRLIVDATADDREANLGKIAHIYSKSNRGPRPFTEYKPTPDLINGFENLLLLCGYHHDLVDAQENTYTVEELQAWKANHLARNLLTKYSHLAHQRKCRRILGATFRFETLDAVVVSVEAPQLRRQVAGNAEAYYHETRVWLERQDGTTFSFDFVGEVPCTINDRVTILSVFPEGGSGFSARLYNHRSCHWIQLPMPPISPLNGHDYLSQREIKITMLGLIAIILCVLLLDQFQFGTLTFFGWSVVVLLVACIAAWQAIRRKKLRSVLDRLQEDVDIS